MIGLKRGVVKLVEHQEFWTEEARNTIAELKGLLGNIAVDIQHIGSTAVPTIHAKPIIDIVVGVFDLNDVLPAVNQLNKNNFIFRGEDIPGQLLFVKGDNENDTRTHHIHIVKWNGIEWNNYVNFRDYLIAFPQKAKSYDDCKQKAAAQYSEDRKNYTAAKQTLINCYIEEARLWKAKQ